MLYCPHCHTLFDDACPLCSQHTGITPNEGDPVFVAEQNDLFSGMLLDVFQQEGIPLMRRQAVGVAPLVGTNLARYRLYTLVRCYDEAMKLYGEVMEPADDLTAEDGAEPFDEDLPEE